MKPLNVFILDDDTEDALCLSYQLSTIENVVVLGIENVPGNAIERILKAKPDILFLDVEMPVLSGFEMITELRKQNSFPTIVLTTCHLQYGIRAIREETFDCLIKPICRKELCNCLNRYYDKICQPNDLENKLSTIECDILKHLCHGDNSFQIGNELCLSPHTVNNYRSQILKKTGVKTTVELLSYYATIQ